MRSGDSIPSELFFKLIREGLLYTHGGGAGREDDERQAPSGDDRERTQIPQTLNDLLDVDGNLISFGAFKVRFGGPGGYDDDVLRQARASFEREFLRHRPKEAPNPSREEQSQPVPGAILKMIWVGERFEKALQYAALIHAGQFRKETGILDIAHLLGVASIALEYGANEDEAIGALLHDAAEDAGGLGRLEDIRVRFGDMVASIVEGCTDAVTIPKPPWRERKRKIHYASRQSGCIHSPCFRV